MKTMKALPRRFRRTACAAAAGPGPFIRTPASWSGGLLPGATHDVIVSVAGLPTIDHKSLASTINSLVVTGAALQVQSGVLTVSGAFGSNATTNVVSGGELSVGGTASFATLGLDGGRVLRNEGTLTQSGGVDLNSRALGTTEAGTFNRSGTGTTNVSAPGLGRSIRFNGTGRALCFEH